MSEPVDVDHHGVVAERIDVCALNKPLACMQVIFAAHARRALEHRAEHARHAGIVRGPGLNPHWELGALGRRPVAEQRCAVDQDGSAAARVARGPFLPHRVSARRPTTRGRPVAGLGAPNVKKPGVTAVTGREGAGGEIGSASRTPPRRCPGQPGRPQRPQRGARISRPVLVRRRQPHLMCPGRRPRPAPGRFPVRANGAPRRDRDRFRPRDPDERPAPLAPNAARGDRVTPGFELPPQPLTHRRRTAQPEVYA